MAEFVSIDTSLPKEDVYSEMRSQIAALIKDESDLIANLSNIVSVLKIGLPSTTWVGFYLMKNDELVLGPFQGKPACVRIAVGKGVCGTAAEKQETVIVPDVSKFPGHIYCDPDSKSEIVVPIVVDGDVYGVLDLDSSELNAYDETDRMHLESIVERIVPFFKKTS